MSFNDPTSSNIATLQPDFAAYAYYFINALRDVGIPAYISSARRTYTEQAKLVAAGASKTMNSKHVQGLAFDVDILGYRRDQLPYWWWLSLGRFWEALGGVWGGRWTSIVDLGHFEA